MNEKWPSGEVVFDPFDEQHRTWWTRGAAETLLPFLQKLIGNGHGPKFMVDKIDGALQKSDGDPLQFTTSIAEVEMIAWFVFVQRHNQQTQPNFMQVCCAVLDLNEALIRAGVSERRGLREAFQELFEKEGAVG